MKYIILSLSVILCFWLFSIVSCVHDPILTPGGGNTTDTIKPIDTIRPIDTIKPILDKICDTTKIFFNRDILPIFVQNCAISGCHDSRTGSEGYVLIDYKTIVKKGIASGKPNNSEIYEVIISKSANKVMPPPPYPTLTTKQINLINKWITDGVKNDTCTDVIACDTSKVTYSGTIQPIFNKYCISCHGKLLNYAGARLDTYLGTVSALGTGRLIGSMTWDPGFTKMPQDQPKLSDCELNKIKLWVSKGALNN